VVTKIQHRTSGPHRGGIPFARGSLFYLLKNPVYRGKIIHKGKVYDGEHRPIVDEDLWDRVQAQLREKAPPRKRPKNDRNTALFNGVIADPEGRPVVPTYSTKGTRRYAFYETRKDLARPGNPAATRFTQGAFDRQVLTCIVDLLGDEHGLRRMANIADASQLRGMFDQAQSLREQLNQVGDIRSALRSLVTAIAIQGDHLELTLDPAALGILDTSSWSLRIPRPTRRPFREAKLRIDGSSPNPAADRQLVKLMADAFEVQALVIASPDLSLNQLAKSIGRCRKQMAKLLSVSWLSPQIVEAITDGSQPMSVTRTRLLETQWPIDWSEQEAMLGINA
jgi:hypothetical protein